MHFRRVSIFLTLLATLFLTNACHHAVTAPVSTLPAVTGTPLPSLTSPSGKTYSRTEIDPADDKEPVVIPPVPPGAAPNLDTFHGTARKAAKLSIASGTPKSFSDVKALLDSLIPDATMRAKHIDSGAGSDRLPEEQKRVTVAAFLYAASRESDNDFHCVIGRDPSKAALFMNVEVSALPPSSSEFFAQLRTTRNQFKTFFTTNGEALPGSRYTKYTPPIPVKVTGSLFFDVDHVPPAVGPTGMKPQTAWEIHPVNNMQFEQ